MNLYPIFTTNITKRKNRDTVLLARLEKAVFDSRPVLGQSYDQFGNLSMIEFTRKQFSNPVSKDISEKKQVEVIATIRKEVAKRLDETIAKRIEKQLQKYYEVITADHQGPLTDPRFLNSNLLIHHALESAEEKRDLLVLACANISFDNQSFPRGHEFHTTTGDEIVKNQLVFFSRKVRPLNVSGHSAYTAENLAHLKERLLAFVREGSLTKEQAEKLAALVDEVYADPAVLNLETFSEQVTKTNFALWKKLVGEDGPNLIYLDQEAIVNQLILDHHLYSNTIINRILFDESIFASFIKYFDGVSRGFSLQKKSGTYLFWGLPKDQKYRVQLWKEGNRLVSPDGSFSVDLTREGLAKAIREKEILSSTLLSFIILTFYYGLTLIGGGRQTTYLTEMKNAYSRFTKAIGDEENHRSVDAVSTDKLATTFPSVALLADKNGKLYPATTIDLLLYGGDLSMKTIKYMAHNVTLQQSLARELPELYRVSIPEDQQEERLSNLSPQAIDSITLFNTVVKPVSIFS